MIFICDLSYKQNSLSYFEYVRPLEEIVKASGKEFVTIHYSLLSETEWKNSEALILCGTALKDNKFIENLNKFSFITNLNIPVIGICAGVQVIACIFGGNIIDNKKIGMTKVKKITDDPLLKDISEFEAYELHMNSVDVPKEFTVVAQSDSGIQIVRHTEKPVYGVVFHPEVRNEWVIINFLEIVRKIRDLV